MSELDERSGGEEQQLPYIDIVGPVRMPPEWNFFDQFPFDYVFYAAANELSTREGTPSAEAISLDIGHMLTEIFLEADSAFSVAHNKAQAARQPVVFDRDAYIADLLLKGMRLMIMLSAKRAKNYPPASSGFGLLSGVMTRVFSDLAPYPQWQTYVGTRRDRSLYKSDGNALSSHSLPKGLTPANYPPSYLAWAEEKGAGLIRIEEALIGQVVRRAFPIGKLRTPRTRVLVPREEPGQFATWRFMKATGRITRLDVPPR
jgi:hypothetical protein